MNQLELEILEAKIQELLKEIESLKAENSRLQAEKDKLKDQIFTGFGGNS